MTRRARLAIGAAIGLLAVVGLLVVTLHRPPSPLERGRRMVADDAKFTTAEDSGLALLRVAQLIRQQAESCRRHDANSERCADLFAATAYAQVQAVSVLRCTRPGVFDTRERMQPYLDALHRGAHPKVPDIINCH